MGLYIKGVSFPYFHRAIRMFPFFYCGALFGLSDKVKGWFIGNDVIYSMSLVIYFILMFTCDKKLILLCIPGIFAIVVLMNLFSYYDKYVPHWLSTVGTYSLEIYVIHYFLLPTLPWVKPLLSEGMKGVSVFNFNIVPLIIVTLALTAVIVALCMWLALAIRHSKWLSAIVLGEVRTLRKE